MKRLLSFVAVCCVVALVGAASLSADEKDLLSQRILQRHAESKPDDNFVAPEIVDNVHSPNPKPVDVSTVRHAFSCSLCRLKSLLTVVAQMVALETDAGFMPNGGFPGAYPGYYNMQPAASAFLNNARFSMYKSVPASRCLR